MVSKDLDQLLGKESDKMVQPAEKRLQLNMMLRLVQPAILVYERKGKLRQVLVPLKIRELTAISLDKRLALVQYFLNLRLLNWLIQRVHIHASSFTSYASPSLLLREAQIWNFSFACSRIDRHLLLDRFDEELERQFVDTLSASQIYKPSVRELKALSKVLKKPYIKAEVLDRTAGKMIRSSDTMDSGERALRLLDRMYGSRNGHSTLTTVKSFIFFRSSNEGYGTWGFCYLGRVFSPL